jgi:tRNA(Ile)-lysidine synthase
MRLHSGSRSLKALFLEARIPARHRASRPVLADGEGRILWIPGIAAAELPATSDRLPEESGLAIAVAAVGGSHAGV